MPHVLTTTPAKIDFPDMKILAALLEKLDTRKAPTLEKFCDESGDDFRAYTERKFRTLKRFSR
jgi:hypothetical protein